MDKGYEETTRKGLKKMEQENNSSLAVSVYILAMRKQIEEEIDSKYSKRIEYLVNANNELMKELEECEEECYGRGGGYDITRDNFL